MKYKTYQIHTLGCKVNEYESEVIENLLNNAGYQKIEDKNIHPDICIINTCTVTNQADSKSRKLIRSLKRKNPKALVVALGCMIQNKKDKLQDIDIDIALGTKDKSKIVSYIEEYQKKQIKKIYDINDMQFENMILNNSNLTRAYIKIQDGCDNYCSYCIIPYVRGHVRSKKKADVIEEAKNLVKKGRQEIVLTGIHTGHYHDNNYTLADLLNDLGQIKGLKRLRISSIEVTELNEKVLNAIKNNKIITNHMHIPLQSGSNQILKAMNRKYTTEYYKHKIKEIRSIRPEISITTDIIVGFPGENEELFQETIKTIKEIQFTKIHVFPYSKREGTKASTMKEQVDGNVKKERVKKLLEISKQLELAYMKKNLNKELTFLPEVYKEGYLIGHTENYLLIKAKGKKEDKNKNIVINTIKIDYPYLEALVKGETNEN